ncbi:MAG: M20/M25/M40 family metallo-hydrolase [Anaerolineae bacterium]|nr:M20/M25/M40 family metallo-hydrolase [Anaerolineae bacterium]
MIDRQRLLDTFLDLVRIDSPSGHEAAIAAVLVDRLRQLDMHVITDAAGNVLARWEGEGEPVLLSAHMDTVAPGIGIQPVVVDGVVRSDGTTILGGDDKSGVAVILEVLTAIHARGMRVPVEVVLTVREETGLEGAKAVDTRWLRARHGLVLDAGGALHSLVSGAPSSDKFDATVHGRAAHAGSHPEEGVNAIRVAAEAIASMPLGRIDDETTSNIGIIRGGEAVNVVPDRVDLRGEARSHDTTKLDRQIDAMRRALQDAVDRHPGARLELDIRRSYQGYQISPALPIVRRIAAALEEMGEPAVEYHLTGGGSDANIFHAHGIAAIPVSTGMQSVHTNQEQIAAADMVRCAELVARVLGASAPSA